MVSETPMHPANASSGIFSLLFRDKRFGIAVGGDYAHPEESDLPSVMFTSDGGATWQEGTPTKPRGVYLSSIAFVRTPIQDGLMAVGTRGAILSPAKDHWITQGSESLNSVAATDNRSAIVWAVGPKGLVLRASMR
jgi:photosystem II stability/assembly factor-like uncharacterized protein